MFNYSTPLSPGSKYVTCTHKLFTGVYDLVVQSVHVLVDLQVELVSSVRPLYVKSVVVDILFHRSVDSRLKRVPVGGELAHCLPTAPTNTCTSVQVN